MCIPPSFRSHLIFIVDLPFQINNEFLTANDFKITATDFILSG
tara:strand:- start:309 stop:437 length:129 start_codon:yes stop_codon:yes gene_type:complete